MPADGHDERDDRGLIDRPASLAGQFDRVADQYEARPDYPARVFEILRERCGLGAGTRVLEIGAGSGQATLPMLELGAAVTAVEPGAALARRLRERAAAADALEVVEATFEDAALPRAAFDLVAAATSFHWVDIEAAPQRCADALRDDGWVALWWTIWGDDDRPDPVHEALQPLLRAKAPELLQPDAGSHAHGGDVAARASAVAHHPAFGPVTEETVRWTGRHDARELRRIFATFSGWIALGEPRFTALLDDVERMVDDELGGVAERPYQTVIFTIPRQPR